jgi:hypothetical protein
LNHKGAVRFRIKRQTSHSTNSNADYGGLIYIDNIIVSYPTPTIKIRPSGKNCGIDPFLRVGKENGRPRIAYEVQVPEKPEGFD